MWPLKTREFYDERTSHSPVGQRQLGHGRTDGNAGRRYARLRRACHRDWFAPWQSHRFPTYGIWVLRSFDEKVTALASMHPPHGTPWWGGLIGCEVAASLRWVSVDAAVEPQAAPSGLGAGRADRPVGTRLHRDEGVDVRTGVTGRVRGSGACRDAVVLTDGTELLGADLVVVGIGSNSRPERLEGSGVEV